MKTVNKWPKDLDDLIKFLIEVENLSWVQVSKKVKESNQNYLGYTPKMIR